MIEDLFAWWSKHCATKNSLFLYYIIVKTDIYFLRLLCSMSSNEMGLAERGQGHERVLDEANSTPLRNHLLYVYYEDREFHRSDMTA